MNDALNDDLAKISEWGPMNGLDFNRKIQCFIPTHKRVF